MGNRGRSVPWDGIAAGQIDMGEVGAHVDTLSLKSRSPYRADAQIQMAATTWPDALADWPGILAILYDTSRPSSDHPRLVDIDVRPRRAAAAHPRDVVCFPGSAQPYQPAKVNLPMLYRISAGY
jgi:hypothetical protein